MNTKLLRGTVLAVLASMAAFGQTSAPKLEFEVASIKLSPPLAPGQFNLGLKIDGAQVRCASFTLKDYIRAAYRVKYYQVSGPDWLESVRFDLAAKLPEGATSEQVPEMLQALLADRFQVKLHRETRDFAVYSLIVGKGGLKMKESPPDADAASGEPAPSPNKGDVNVAATASGQGVNVSLGKGSSFSFGNNKFEGRKLNMVGVADTLARFVDRPVVDMTDVKGSYDFTLDFSPEDFRAMMIRAALSSGVVLPPEAMRALEGASGDSLFTAVQNLGLKLEPRKAPLEVLVIDQALKEPTAN